jgi:ArsR family transcriptional regulator, arsenate/arsenite/antimonite-responsive transcriptional repressor
MNEVFKALSDPTRREILRVLRQQAYSAGELAELFPLAKSTLSGHFNVLKAADLVVQEKRGTAVIYRLNTSVFEEVVVYLFDFFGSQSSTNNGVNNSANYGENHSNKSPEKEVL